IFNYLRRGGVVVVAEGLQLAETPVPEVLVGKSLAEAAIPSEAGCNVVALRSETGLEINPDSATVLAPDAEIILIGTPESEERFMKLYGAKAMRATPIAPSEPTTAGAKSSSLQAPASQRSPAENRPSLK
ncbi:MAG: TrkA C-terminal domain-containing protein, partial [Terrimicrobiaceae bacterium]